MNAPMQDRATPGAPARFSRMQRLQVILLVVLGIWSIESGMQTVRDDATTATPDVSAAGDEPGAIVRQPLDERALATYLADVNPVLEREETRRIASAVIRYSARYDLDPELVTAVLLVESTARPWVRSPKGAVGLMQVMPHMMEPLDLPGNAATIESNIEAGCFILANNIRRLGEEQGISSYFWGSDIRGTGYLRKVQAARLELRRQLAS